MKTSKKIVLTLLGVFIALLVTGLMLLKNDMRAVVDKMNAEFKYEEVAVKEFERLEFSSDWEVKIRPGNEYKVELSMPEHSGISPNLKNRDGTLFFDVDSPNEISTETLRAKVFTPKLTSIKAGQNTLIQMNDMDTDTLDITIDNGVFKGKGNKLDIVTFTTSGNTVIQIEDNGL